MRHKKFVHLRKFGMTEAQWNDQDFPLFQRLVVPVLLLLCVLVVGL